VPHRLSAFQPCFSEFVVYLYKHLHNRSKCFESPKKTSALSPQSGCVCPQVRGVRVAFGVDVPDILALKIRVSICLIAVGGVFIDRRNAIGYPLRFSSVLLLSGSNPII
jgi:hypothetical protein